jgi:aminoglycoside phosphotransferase (APT) family kinase protein
VKDLKQKITQLIPFSDNVRELRHGDFGNDNVLIENNKIQGIIDWHKASYDDHLFDVSRVVLYCPNRHASSKAALDYYQNLSHENYKERILLGVYFTMLINYGFAAKAGMSKSLKSSPERIKEIEEYFL